MAGGKCYHTGLPVSMCGHCNGTTPLEVEPPSIYAVKPHEKLGESTGVVGSALLAKAVVEGSHWTKMPRSAWGRDQMMLTIKSMGITQEDAAKLRTIEGATKRPVAPVITKNVDGQHTKLRHTAAKPIPKYAAENFRRARTSRRIDVMKHIRKGTFSNNPHEGGIE